MNPHTTPQNPDYFAPSPFHTDTHLEFIRNAQEVEARAAAARLAEQQEQNLQEARELHLFEAEVKAEAAQERLTGMRTQAQQLLLIARAQNPTIPSVPGVLEVIVAEVERGGDAELSIGSINEAFQRLCQQGIMTADYSSTNKQRALAEIDSVRQRGVQVDDFYLRDPSTYTPAESEQFMRQTAGVPIAGVLHLTNQLKAYEEWKKPRESAVDTELARRKGSAAQRASKVQL